MLLFMDNTVHESNQTKENTNLELLVSNFDFAERLNRFLHSRGTRVQISSWSLRLRFNLSFWTNRGNYHGFNSTIWLYMLSYEPLT